MPHGWCLLQAMTHILSYVITETLALDASEAIQLFGAVANVHRESRSLARDAIYGLAITFSHYSPWSPMRFYFVF